MKRSSGENLPNSVTRPLISNLNRAIVGYTSFFSLIFTFFLAMKLRPVADDFCFADATRSGVISSIEVWYRTWVGDIPITFLNTVLVGLPLTISVKLSLVTLVFAISVIAGAGASIFILNHRSAGSAEIVGSIFLGASWVCCLWIPALGEQVLNAPEGLSNKIAQQSTFWQVVNSSYTIPVTIVIALMLYISRRNLWDRKNSPINVSFAFIISILIGMSGYVLFVSTLLWTCLLYIRRFKTRALLTSIITFKLPFYWVIGSISGFLLSYLSPGVKVRKSYLEEVSPIHALAQIPKVSTFGFMTWLELLTSAFFFLAILSGIILGCVIRKVSVAIDAALIFDLFSMFTILIIVNSVSEIFSYRALPHIQTAMVALFFLGIAIGDRISTWILTGFESHRWIISRTLVLLWIILCALTLIFLKKELTGFLTAWNLGKPFHSLPGYTSGWISQCARSVIS